MMTVYKSIADEKIINRIPDALWTGSLFQYAAYKCKIDGLIAAASLFCPEIVEINGYVFIRQFWNCDDEKESLELIKVLEKQFDFNKKRIEMHVNTWSVGDLFYVGDIPSEMDNEEILNQFGKVLCYFWENRLLQLFPERKFEVMLGEELEGEIGLCISIYEIE